MSNSHIKSAWKVQLNRQAKLDYVDILKWTTKTFGNKQASIYATTLDLSLETLRHQGSSTLGIKQRDDIAPGILTLHIARDGRKGRHFIVFRIGSDHCIQVLRLLHDAMDLSNHLPS